MRFDALVVGAGASGLAAGCLLAEAGRRVAVLEHHSIPGGLLQRFRRGGIPFDTGFHYMGGAGPGGPLRPYLQRLGVLERIELLPFDPDGFDEVVLPSRRVALPQGADRVGARLSEEFPGEARGIREYLALVEDAVRAHAPSPTSGSAPPERRDPETVIATLDRLVGDADLRAVLSAHAVLYGVPAALSPFEAHAVVSASYWHSAHGVRGGGTALAEAMTDRLAELGGELRLRTGVRRILSDGDVVTGVESDAGEVLSAPVVVSTAHPAATLGLLGGAPVPPRHVRRVRDLRESSGALLVHAIARGVPPPPLRRNRLWFESAEAAWCEPRRWFAAGDLPASFVILPGPETPEAPGASVFQAFCPLATDDLPEVRDEAERASLKRAAALRIVPLVERCVPEWTGRIEVVDVSTPRAVQRYVRSPTGSCFGVACTVNRPDAPNFATGFGLRGLASAGQSVGLPGLYGSIVSAFAAASRVVGRPV